jgi:hypothetical protein
MYNQVVCNDCESAFVSCTRAVVIISFLVLYPVPKLCGAGDAELKWLYILMLTFFSAGAPLRLPAEVLNNLSSYCFCLPVIQAFDLPCIIVICWMMWRHSGKW